MSLLPSPLLSLSPLHYHHNYHRHPTSPHSHLSSLTPLPPPPSLPLSYWPHHHDHFWHHYHPQRSHLDSLDYIVGFATRRTKKCDSIHMQFNVIILEWLNCFLFYFSFDFQFNDVIENEGDAINRVTDLGVFSRTNLSFELCIVLDIKCYLESRTNISDSCHVIYEWK